MVDTQQVTTFDDAPGSTTSGRPARGLDPEMRRVFEAAELAVATVDTEGHVVSATSAFAAHFGRTIEELVGVHLVGLCPEQQRAEMTATLVRLVEGASEIELVDSRAPGVGRRTHVLRMTLGRLTDGDGGTTGVACTVTDVSEAHRELRRGDHVDLLRPVGGVPDGSALEPLLAIGLRRSARSGRPLSVMRCEISGLPDDAGVIDQVLEVHAERLVARLRPSDTVCRDSDAGFTVLAEDLGDEQDAVGVAYRMLSTAVEPVHTDGAEWPVSVTIGIVVADSTASAHSILDAADAALSEAREDGVGGFRLIDLRPGLAA